MHFFRISLFQLIKRSQSPSQDTPVRESLHPEQALTPKIVLVDEHTIGESLPDEQTSSRIFLLRSLMMTARCSMKEEEKELMLLSGPSMRSLRWTKS